MTPIQQIAQSVIRDQVTPESIAWAVAEAQRERDEVERQTGVRVRPDGTIVLPRRDR